MDECEEFEEHDKEHCVLGSVETGENEIAGKLIVHDVSQCFVVPVGILYDD